MAKPLPDIDGLLKDLRSDDAIARKNGRATLDSFQSTDAPITLENRLKLLRAASESRVVRKHSDDNAITDVCADLVRAAVNKPSVELIPIVVESFGKYTDRGKRCAQMLLTRLEDRDAAEALVRIVRDHARTHAVPGLMIAPLIRKPRHADVFFPELLGFATAPALANDIYHLCLVYCDAKLLSAETIAPYTRQVLEAYRSAADKVRPAQREGGIAWMFDDDYAEHRFTSGLLLDLMHHFPGSGVDAELRQALNYRDPRLKHFAVVSLLKRGMDVDPQHIDRVAASSEMRNLLYESLQRIGKQALFPEKYRTQAAFAECDMVQWLTFPTELGRVPDEIELMKVVPVDTGAHRWSLRLLSVPLSHAPSALGCQGWLDRRSIWAVS